MFSPSQRRRLKERIPGLPRRMMNPIRSLYRRLYWGSRDAKVRELMRGCGQALIMGDTLGDNLFLTAIVRERRARGLPGVCISTPAPGLFENLEGVNKIVPLDWSLLDSCRRLHLPGVQPFYSTHSAESDTEVPPARHILAETCALAGLRGAIQLKPALTLMPAELREVDAFAGSLVFQSSGLSGARPMLNKEWGASRFSEVARRLEGRLPLLQIGGAKDPPLPGCTDLRGKTTLRQTAAILASARGFVGLVGFPMHLARAVDCPSVIVYGGREKARQSGYVCNVNLEANPACSPCWRWQTCDHDRVCLSSITPAQVVAAIAELLGRPRDPLPVETAEI